MVTRLIWSQNNDRAFETGLDRGVLYLRSGETVPWDGLTELEETGGDEVTSYFIDGRPFLHKPIPKEFEAVLKAYTYPEEFSAVMGFDEIADGMYIDSQLSDQFDLSYRTLMGGTVNTGKHHYKIHLVYNAVVVPASKSYVTVGNDINPVDFSWEIKAVPVSLKGHRSTAHIVIDSRRVDPARLKTVEDLLYGTDTATGVMPSPSDVYDILNFSDSVIITDNGDGTWTAEGPNVFVKTKSDGTFTIDSVNHVHYDDGTYILGNFKTPYSTETVDGGKSTNVNTNEIDGGSSTTTSTNTIDGGSTEVPM